VNILVNGCSFSRGPNSWPYFLNCTSLVNLACAAAGNNYICDSTIRELQKRSYDHVVIMWSGLERYDIQGNFVDNFYTSKYQSARNDWPKKVISLVNDQDYVEKDWIFGIGNIQGDKDIRQSNIFTGIYKYSTAQQLVNNSIIKMISLQSYLKCNKISYTFSFYQDYEVDFNAIDKENCEVSDNISNIMHRLNSYDADGAHPGKLAHREWANILNANRLNI
jgi:hypothetical protein